MIDSLKNSAPQKRCRNDIFLILGILLAVSIFALIYFLTQKDGAYAIVLKDGEQIGSFTLSQNAKIPITDGEEVTNVLVIRDGKAYMESAICPDKLCVKHKAVSKAGQTIVCLPSKIVVKIIANEAYNSPDTVV